VSYRRILQNQQCPENKSTNSNDRSSLGAIEQQNLPCAPSAAQRRPTATPKLFLRKRQKTFRSADAFRATCADRVARLKPRSVEPQWAGRADAAGGAARKSRCRRCDDCGAVQHAHARSPCELFTIVGIVAADEQLAQERLLTSAIT
jgi:hypothetical protein